ncbi:MAG: lipocalin family protein [Bacteroidetes bacterium]|nr:lipocalin family protein [Bacteroidota bacterium]
MKSLLLIIMSFFSFLSESGIAEVTAIGYVDLKRYTGTWYEIARLPNSFERGLKCATATYTLRDNGRITVVNKGQKISDPSETKVASGVAWVPDKTYPAKLKVRFFWPFSGDYWILALDPSYRFVLVGDPSRKYLWILSRTKKMDDQDYQHLLEKAKEQGFDVTKLMLVEQNCP